MQVNMLDRGLLLALAAVLIERVEQGPRELVGLVQVLPAPLECLLAAHGAPEAFRSGIVRGEQLSSDYAFKLVFRSDAVQPGKRRLPQTMGCLRIGMLEPKRPDGLLGACNSSLPIAIYRILSACLSRSPHHWLRPHWPLRHRQLVC
jgi:hypothetical protein